MAYTKRETVKRLKRKQPHLDKVHGAITNKVVIDLDIALYSQKLDPIDARNIYKTVSKANV